MHRASDRDSLALATGQLAHGGVHGDSFAPEADGVEHDLVGDGFLLFHVDEAKAIRDLSPTEEVSPQSLFLAERFVLIDSLDAVPVGALDVVPTKIDFPTSNV